MNLDDRMTRFLRDATRLNSHEYLPSSMTPAIKQIVSEQFADYIRCIADISNDLFVLMKGTEVENEEDFVLKFVKLCDYKHFYQSKSKFIHLYESYCQRMEEYVRRHHHE